MKTRPGRRRRAGRLAPVRGRRSRRSALAGVLGVVAGLVAVGTGLVQVPDLEQMLEPWARGSGPGPTCSSAPSRSSRRAPSSGWSPRARRRSSRGGRRRPGGDRLRRADRGRLGRARSPATSRASTLGRRLGRGFLERHGPRVRTPRAPRDGRGVLRPPRRQGDPDRPLRRARARDRAVPRRRLADAAAPLPALRRHRRGALGQHVVPARLPLLASFGPVTTARARHARPRPLIVVIVAAIVSRAACPRPGAAGALVDWIAARRLPAARPAARHAPGSGGGSAGRSPCALGPARWVRDRVTPGELGLELTTLLAASSGRGVGVLRDPVELAERPVLPGDAEVAAARTPSGPRWRRRREGAHPPRVVPDRRRGGAPHGGLGGAPRARGRGGRARRRLPADLAGDRPREGEDRARAPARLVHDDAELSYPSGTPPRVALDRRAPSSRVLPGMAGVRFAAVVVAVGVVVSSARRASTCASTGSPTSSAARASGPPRSRSAVAALVVAPAPQWAP